MLDNMDFLESWVTEDNAFYSTDELLDWVEGLNKNTYVKVVEDSILKSDFWFYDDYRGEVLNRKRSFFSIIGMRRFEDNVFIKEQPIIIQPEIGYLGIICRKIDGVLYFLMQAKIEPGNVNCVQISPTIQATKSNFLRAHGGKLPAYFEYFEKAYKYDVIYDQIQSEQGARFYKKRNRNIIIFVEDEIEVLPNFRWMTLGQIKRLLKIDNLVNMDTRTVISGIPFFKACKTEKQFFNDVTLYNSIFENDPKAELGNIYQKINNYKMFKEITTTSVPLNQLIDWNVDEYGIVCKKDSDFEVRYYDIEISGREVQSWTQPLFKATGMALFGLVTKVVGDKRVYLIQIKSEMGSFDKVELGPAIQWEPTHKRENDNNIDSFVRSKIESRDNSVILDILLSEEGGRFYHEQNRNIIIEIDDNELVDIPDSYIWVSYSTLNYLILVNNCLNIQLRNLISLIDI